VEHLEQSPATVLARYVSALRFESLPSEVVERAKALVEDNVGCAVGALAAPEAQAILSVAKACAESRVAWAIGSERTSIGAAAFCNAQLSNLLDFDDMHDYFMPHHPGCLVVPTALAIAQATGASGPELLTAVVAAYEVAMRVGRSMGNTLWTGA
jgi:2-methylcitrate dehydratase PrpD